MPTLPLADWLTTLGDMDAALAAAAAALGGYEARWPEPPPAPAAVPLLEEVGHRFDGWNDRLVAAGQLAAAAEREVGAGEAGVGRWREAFTRWRAGIQQPTGSAP